MTSIDTPMPAHHDTVSCKLSLILAAYNSAEYIRECLASVLDVVPADGSVELLVIDDGSTDETPAILREYGDRIRLFTLPNGGVAAARNFALGQVRGEYIGYIDADDYWSKDVSWAKLEALLNRGADIVEFDTDVVDGEGNFSEHFHVTCTEANVVTPLTDKLLKTVCNRWHWYLWARFYRRELWEAIRFPEGKIYSDALTLPFVYHAAESVLCADFTLVKYRIVPTSLSRGVSPKRVSSLLWGIEHFQRASSSNNDIYALCARRCYEMMLRTAVRVPDEALGSDFFAIVTHLRRQMWQMAFTTRLRSMLCLLAPRLCFDYFRWKHRRHTARLSQPA